MFIVILSQLTFNVITNVFLVVQNLFKEHKLKKARIIKTLAFLCLIYNYKVITSKVVAVTFNTLAPSPKFNLALAAFKASLMLPTKP